MRDDICEQDEQMRCNLRERNNDLYEVFRAQREESPDEVDCAWPADMFGIVRWYTARVPQRAKTVRRSFFRRPVQSLQT